uniref:fibronectin-like n=1 Tax=Styela clava TaxID=7725 RepID=UPI001939D03F|nr:fibronectin-like [Styela clava]
MLSFRGICLLLMSCCGIVTSVIVIPRPILDVADVTSYSITLNWTLPINELFDEFVVEISPEEGDVLDFEPKEMKRSFINLTPGTLYTFTVRTVRQETFSDTSVLLQDTVPLPPNELELRTFDTLVLVLGGPYFQDTEFTVDIHGVEATWGEPADGISECYHAEIFDEDGLQAIPGGEGEVDRGDTLRQFVNLTPGKNYKVTVYSSTCGEGHLGELRSDGISSEIRLPPADPPTIIVEEVTTTTSELRWDKEKIEGFYDDFEVVQVGDSPSSIVIDDPASRTTLGRNLSNLIPCSKYEVDVYTLLDGQRSKNGQRAIVETLPNDPIDLVLVDFTESSATLEWRQPIGSTLFGYIIQTTPPPEKPLRTNETSITLEGLLPGIQYKIEVKSVCQLTEQTLSTGTTTTMTTKPLPPVVTTSECTYIGTDDETKSLYELVPWEAPDPSRINLTWSKPTSGSWDNFLVDYSPYEFEQGLSSPSAPMILGNDVIRTEINIPVSGRVITASIRTISNNVVSEPVVKSIFCGGPDGESSLRCRSILLYWTIKITPIENATKLLVEIPSYPIYNATVFMGDSNEVLMFYNHTFTIRNPCDKGPASRITVFPQCPSILPFCPTITRRLCTNRRGHVEDLVIPDACCNSRLYNTDNEVCCHSKLLKKFERSTEECCVTRWYNRKTQKCCETNPLTKYHVVKNGAC